MEAKILLIILKVYTSLIIAIRTYKCKLLNLDKRDKQVQILNMTNNKLIKSLKHIVNLRDSIQAL